MKKFELKIGNRLFAVRLSFRSLIAYERLSGKPYSTMSTLEDTLMYLYCCIISSNEYNCTWDDFLNMMDDYPSVLDEFIKQIANKEDGEEKK